MKVLVMTDDTCQECSGTGYKDVYDDQHFPWVDGTDMWNGHIHAACQMCMNTGHVLRWVELNKGCNIGI